MSLSESVQCLKLVESYIEEVEGAIDQIKGDENGAYDLLNTLNLAMNQTEKAEQMDPTANLDGIDIPVFKARILGNRGVVENLGFSKRSSAILNLQKAIALCDDIDVFHYAIGVIFSQTGKKEDALRHLKRAVELDPDNMEYRKLLDRIENVSSAGMAVGAFRGSWKVILVLSGLSLIGLIMAGSGEAEAGITSFLFWGAIAFIYWKVKSR